MLFRSRQLQVVLGANGDCVLPLFGEFRAVIPRHCHDDLVVAAIDQHVGDARTDRLARRNGQQMILALGPGAFDEKILIEEFRLRQHRAGDANLVVAAQPSQNLIRRGLDRGQSLGHLRSHGRVDLVDDAHHHLVEEADLRWGTACVKIGRAHV